MTELILSEILRGNDEIHAIFQYNLPSNSDICTNIHWMGESILHGKMMSLQYRTYVMAWKRFLWSYFARHHSNICAPRMRQCYFPKENWENLSSDWHGNLWLVSHVIGVITLSAVKKTSCTMFYSDFSRDFIDKMRTLRRGVCGFWCMTPASVAAAAKADWRPGF